MTDSEAGQFDRRQMIGGGLLLAALVGTPAWIWAQVRSGETGEATAPERRMLATVSDIVLPATGTPSASALGVPAFVELALNHGLDGTRKPKSDGEIQAPVKTRDGLLRLEDLLGRLTLLSGGDFNAASPQRQYAAVAKIDADAFTPEGKDDPWHKIKDLILIGYYTSEIGGSKELRYELVPGRWDPNIAIGPNDRAFSSDWTAVDFG